ncbi:MAG TPA: hypothetical protein ENJ41_05535 [Oceanospirillales bacterium]|nr:hypothetical protein [Oceanospirillales bacterium]
MKKIQIISLLLVPLSIAAQNINTSQLPKLDEKTNSALNREVQTLLEPSGQITLDTQGGFQNTTLTRINDAGEIETFCTNNAEDARKFLAGYAIEALENQGE